MESEESSAESDDEEEEDDEEEDDEDEDKAEDETATGAVEENEQTEQDESNAVMQKIESDHHNEEPKDSTHQDVELEDQNKTENVEIAEDTALQEPIPMDIDESLMIERRRDVPARASTDSKLSPKEIGTIDEASSVPEGNENAPTGLLSDCSTSLVAPDSAGDNVPETTELVDVLPKSFANEAKQNESALEFAGVGEGTMTITENEETERMAAAEMLFDLSATGGDIMTSGNAQPVEAAPAKDPMTIADSDTQLFTLILDEPLDRIPIREFIRICLRVTVPFCLYCNHARRIAVSGRQLVLHIIAMHRFQATVNSITGEELLPETILHRFLNSLDELETEQAYLNVETFDNSWTSEQRAAIPFVKVFECFQCRFTTVVHKELYLHNRKMHQKSVLLCLMCKGNFFSYSELLCHMCPGVSNHTTALDYMFRCCVCNVDSIPSAFRLMVHLRKRHYACDVCLEECLDQSRLSNHVWKHKLHHLCYRCGIGYRNKADILKHLFWKHGTEGVLCKRCLQKKWPHVYHFCVPPAQFVCEVCQATFNRSVALKVHRRLHNGDAKYPCTEDVCEKRFISKKLLLKHVHRHYLEKSEAEKEQAVESMDIHPILSAGEDIHDGAPVGSGAKTTDEDESVGPLKTEPQTDDIDKSLTKSSGTTDAERNDVASDETKVQSMEELADKDTIKKESNEDSDSTKPLDGKDGDGTADSKEQISEDSNRKESAKLQETEAATAVVETMDVSTPVKKSKKKRKMKDDDKSMVDLMNLPALNLSESDSSDDSDNENSNASFNSKRIGDFTETENGNLWDDSMESKVDGANLMHTEESTDQEQLPENALQRKDSKANEEETVERNENTSEELGAALDPIANIWNNFKRYQANHRTASRKQSADEEQRIEDELVDKMLKTTILHVSQSDHDYCMMFKPILSEAELEAEMQSKPQQESLLLKGGRDAEESTGDSRRTPEMAIKSSGKRNEDRSSDSEDSSDSDSSCECGSNCSCSSSSSNSSSSSSDDSDSSDNEDARKGNKKAAGSDHTKKEDGRSTSPAVSVAEVIAQIEPEVVEELPPPEPVDPDSVIVDSDLHTDESETDEEFYDEHPQKLANQLLAEKRRQLLAQTGASMNYGMVENSRPSTPSLPPDEQAQGKKKVKPKKRKRERKSSKRFMSPAGSTFVEQQVPVTTTTVVPVMDVASYVPQHIAYHWPLGEQQLSGFVPSASAELGPATGAAPLIHNLNQPQQMMLPTMAPLEMPAAVLPIPGVIPVQQTPLSTVPGDDGGKISAPRLSTGNSSESDAPLKRSQRSRKPNKFYGYTSDDESAAASLPLPSGITLSTNPEKSILSLMKPTPPPNLVWSKEDLPSPPAKSSKIACGAGVSSKMSSGQRRSVDHLTPVSSRRNSGIGMSQDELGAVPSAAALVEQQHYSTVHQLQTPTTMVSTLLPSHDPSTPISQSHPPLPKLKLSLGKKSSVTSVTPKGVKQAANNSRRRKPPTPRTPKVKTPKSAPPMGINLHGSTMLPIGTPGTPGPLSAPLVPSAGGVASSALYQSPSVVESRPKIPPIGSFPSIQTDLFRPNQIRVPAGWRAPKEGESVYCYCRAPYDEVSEMIACDDDNCRIEWFHFECVGIIMPPKGKWFCPDCKLRQVQSGTVLLSGMEREQESGQSAAGNAIGGDEGMSSLAVATSTNGSSLAQPSSAYTHWGQPQ
uniref:PHD-type domain-containing protein n=1 Tax=Anopheles christyi TaxID=43041 RepID=A0A182JRA2_9DIPT